MVERLTDRGIAALKPVAGKPYFVFDAEVSGLAVKVYQVPARRSFVFDWRENRKQRRVTIGRFPAWTIGKARTRAAKMRLRADVGDSVAPGRGGRVADLIERWRETVRLTRRPGTATGYSRMIDGHIVPAFGKDDPKAITRNRVEVWHGQIAARTPIHANRALGVLSSFMSWLEHDRKIERNPCPAAFAGVRTNAKSCSTLPRSLAAHRALDADPNRAAALALRLALLTGCRIGEAMSLTAAQLDIGRRPRSSRRRPPSRRRCTSCRCSRRRSRSRASCWDWAACRATTRAAAPGCASARSSAARTCGSTTSGTPEPRHWRAVAPTLPQIGKVLGHTSPATTQRYLHLVDADLVDLIERS